MCLINGAFITVAQKPSGKPVLFSYNSSSAVLSKTDSVLSAHPLETVAIAGSRGATIRIADGKGKEYISLAVKPVNTFLVSGALGKHTVKIYDANKKVIDSMFFTVDAQTNIDDHGAYKELFELLYKGMSVYAPGGVQSIDWNGKLVHFFESWELDNYNCLKGLQYFSPYGGELTDVMRTMQRKDGMIWSFIAQNSTSNYFETAYKKYDFFLRDGNCYFVRQPIENHVEYIYVNTIYKHWKGSGNGSGDDISFHILLPEGANVRDVLVDDKKIAFSLSTIENAHYVDFSMKMEGTKNIRIDF